MSSPTERAVCPYLNPANLGLSQSLQPACTEGQSGALLFKPLPKYLYSLCEVELLKEVDDSDVVVAYLVSRVFFVTLVDGDAGHLISVVFDRK